MPIQLRKLSIILILFIGYPLASISSSESHSRLQGLVLDKTGKGIGYARIVVMTRSDEVAKTKHENQATGHGYKNRLVTYSDKRGNWQIDIPGCQSFLIRIYSNAYETGQKRVAFDEWNKKRAKIELVLTEGLSHILWGSLEHIQLYVHSVHQKNVEYLIKAGDLKAVDAYLEKRVESDQKMFAFVWAGYFLFENSQPEASRIYFDKAGSKLWFNLMGKFHLREKRSEEALSYYLNGVTTRDRADDLFHLAKKFEHEGKLKDAGYCYELAVSDYRSLLNNLKYKWNSDHFDKISYCLKKLSRKFKVDINKDAGKKELKAILNKAGKYCQRLDRTKMHYFCHEVKKDKVILIKKLAKAIESPVNFFRKFSPIKLKGTRIVDFYKYDLQFVKEDKGIVNEKRKLLFEELDNSNPGIPVLSYSILEPLHGPHTLIGFGWQHLFHYKIVAEETIFDEEVLVVDVTPKLYSNLNRSSGKMWIGKGSGSVLKIEWCQLGVSNREQLRAIGFIVEREPELKFVSEFAIKKGGLRFPSRCRMVESYVNSTGERFVRLDVEINYKNYRFFMVSSDVELKD